MYEKLPLHYIGITDGFGLRNNPTTNTLSFHYAVDFGWHKYRGEPVYAIYDSKVIEEGYGTNLGNYIVFTYEKDEKTIIYRFLHFKERALVKKGEKVTRGQIVGYMGTTGDSIGVHLHFEYWICPKNYNYNYADRSKYAVDPLKHVYFFEDQEANINSISLLKKVVGTSLIINRNEKANQIEVINELLNCREQPSLSSNINGYIDYGIYDILEIKENDNYKWYKIGENKWIANVKTDTKELVKDEEEIINNSIELVNYKEFLCLKDGTYYIKLNKGEKIYFPKL